MPPISKAEVRPTFGEFRFRNRLPVAGEGKQPANDLRATVTAEGSDTVRVGRIYLYDYIDSWGGFWGTSAAEVAQALDELGQVDQLHVHINSGGGEVYEAIAIKNLFTQYAAEVTAYVDGIAASAVSFIAAAADTAVMGENSELMIHDVRTYAAGDAARLRDVAADLDRLSDNIASVYAKKAGGTVADWRAVMVGTRYYSAEEAVEAGLADSVGADTVPADEAEVIAPEDPELDDPAEPSPEDSVPVDSAATDPLAALRAQHLRNQARAKGLVPA